MERARCPQSDPTSASASGQPVASQLRTAGKFTPDSRLARDNRAHARPRRLHKPLAPSVVGSASLSTGVVGVWPSSLMDSDSEHGHGVL